MKPSRTFVRLAPGLAAGALLAATAAPALALDPPNGSLKSREFSAVELAVSSSHVPLDDVLAELPNRRAWERFRSAQASGVAERVHVFIDPRGGAATDILAPFPLLPGDGVGNRVSLADLSARLGREIEGLDASVVADVARLFVLEHARLLGITAAELGTVRATQVAGPLWQVSAPQVVRGITVRDARLALTISHGNVVAFGTEGWGTVALPKKAPVAAEKAMAAAFAYAGGLLQRDTVLHAPTFEIVAMAPAGAPAGEPYTGPVGRGYVHRLVYSMTFRRPPE
jgi:trimeric autotransporter adhesin